VKKAKDIFAVKMEGCRKAYRSSKMPENNKFPMPLCAYANDGKCSLGEGIPTIWADALEQSDQKSKSRPNNLTG